MCVCVCVCVCCVMYPWIMGAHARSASIASLLLANARARARTHARTHTNTHTHSLSFSFSLSHTNTHTHSQVEDTLKADLDFLPDVQVDVDKARLVLRKFRIPPKYRMGVAWREQFDPALGKEVVRQRAYNMFCGLDSDGSGRLDHAELLQGVSFHSQRLRPT